MRPERDTPGSDFRQGERRCRLIGLASSSPVPAVEPPAAAPAFEARVLAELDAIRLQLHDLRRMAIKLPQPVDLIDVEELARRTGYTVRNVRRLCARGVFTDARGNRVMGSKRMFYADEAAAWRAGGEAAVRRHRKELGRG